MVLGKVFERFVEQAPICMMARAVLERALSESVIDQLFDHTAQRQYTRKLMFSSVVDLMGLVVCRVRASLHAAYQATPESLEGSLRSLYEKIAGMETGVSEALVRHTAQELRPVIHELGADLPSWVPGHRVRILDGNHLPGTEHRLKPLRTTRAGALPGHALVVLEPEAMLVSEVVLCEDGHAQERSLTNRILSLVEAGDVWLADRNFCTTALLFGIAQREAAFVIRQHASTLTIASMAEPIVKGRTDTGMVVEQAMTLMGPAGERLAVRRISVRLDTPTRDGDEEVHIVTNVPETVLDALAVAQLYRRRWTLETAFQELEATLNSEITTLGYPKAALFAFSLALVAYNILAVVKAALRATHGQELVQQTVSGYYLADEIAGTTRALAIAFPDEVWHVVVTLSVPEFADLLRQWARHANLSRYQKHPRGPKKPRPRRTSGAKQKHVATSRLLASL